MRFPFAILLIVVAWSPVGCDRPPDRPSPAPGPSKPVAVEPPAQAEAAEPKTQAAHPQVAGLEDADGATIYQRVCAHCHGAQGEGRADLKSPSIAGMPIWYSGPQIAKFKDGARGGDPQDVAGYLMRSIALQLTDPMTERVLDHVKKMPPKQTTNTLAGDPVAGKKKYFWYCISCHRYNASGELVFGSPPLTQLQDWYMAEQLKKFHTGLRGKHPRDEKGQKMALVAEFVYQPEDIRDILAYIAELAKKPQNKKRP